MILLTGASGYVGGRLLRRLQEQGLPVRCLCRNPEAVRQRAAPGTQIVPGDLLQPSALGPLFSGIDTAFYLVHSMQAGAEFEEREKECAANFARAARAAHVRRIIYLGGLAHGPELSPHMRSREATGDILRASGIPVIEFRASIILGSGSSSFELIRSLVERLPVMITPRWVHTAAQPIAIEDVIEYLAEALDLEPANSLVVEIGGCEVTSYLGIMREYARQRGLRRWWLAVPFLSPNLSSRWLTLITPVYASIGRCLIESVRTPSIVRNAEPARLFRVRPMGITQAIERAIANEDRGAAVTRWCDAAHGGDWAAAAGNGCDLRQKTPSLLTDERTARVPLPPHLVFAPVRRIGGQTGWYFCDWLWRIRGLFDLLTGGVGMRRGRPDAETPLPGSTLDFWRVQAYEPDRRLLLFAEMKVPGRAWLEFSVEPDAEGAIIRQVAYFEPRGLAGLMYWYSLWPIHQWMFRGMLRRIVSCSENAVAVTNAASPSPVR